MRKLAETPTLKSAASIILYATLIFSASFSVFNSVNDNGKLVFIKELPVENEILKKYAQIGGAVSYPGIYEIQTDTKVGDLISMAGGITSDIDSVAFEQDINLVRSVEDGEKVLIPTSTTSPSTDTSTQANLININTANAKELDALPGVGEVTAAKIIENRPFTKVDELLELKILTQSRFDDIKELITI